MAEDKRLLMKRKDIDRVYEEFSDFSLSSPARKIRRLDIDLPPIMEDEEIDMAMQETASEELEPATPVNEERAIVLFKPFHDHHPPSGQLFVDRDLISDFKKRFLRDASIADGNRDGDQTTNECQVVVCWNQSQPSYSQSTGNCQQPRRALEITELDETGEDAVMDEAAMDIEEDNTNANPSSPKQGRQQHEDPTYGFDLHQWQQQHCLIPQLPKVSTTPITWFR